MTRETFDRVLEPLLRQTELIPATPDDALYLARVGDRFAVGFTPISRGRAGEPVKTASAPLSEITDPEVQDSLYRKLFED